MACLPGPDAINVNLSSDWILQEGAFRWLKESQRENLLWLLECGESMLYHRIILKIREELMPPRNQIFRLTAGDRFAQNFGLEQGAKYDLTAALRSQREAWTFPLISHGVKFNWFYCSKEKMKEKWLKPNPEAKINELIKRARPRILTGLPPSQIISPMFWWFSKADLELRRFTLMGSLSRASFWGKAWRTSGLDVFKIFRQLWLSGYNIRTQLAISRLVIHAFNQNLPYDQFHYLQLAAGGPFTMLPREQKY